MRFHVNWRTASIMTSLGVLLGLSLFTFDFADGTSYFSDDPNACVNCHVMREQFTGWTRSSHMSVATCNDCHTPHGFLEKWIVKGLNGWNHSLAFTTGNFPNTIRIKPFNAEVAQDSCVDCHQALVSSIHRMTDNEVLSCISCHEDAGH